VGINAGVWDANIRYTVGNVGCVLFLLSIQASIHGDVVLDIIRLVVSLVLLKLLWLGIKPWISTLYVNRFIPSGEIKYLEKAIEIHPETENLYQLVSYYNNKKKFCKAADVAAFMQYDMQGGIHKGAAMQQAAVVHANMGNGSYAIYLSEKAKEYIHFPERSVYQNAQKLIELIEGKHEHN